MKIPFPRHTLVTSPGQLVLFFPTLQMSTFHPIMFFISPLGEADHIDDGFRKDLLWWAIQIVLYPLLTTVALKNLASQDFDTIWWLFQQIPLAMQSANIFGNAISKYFWQCYQQIFLAMPSADSATTIAYYGFSLVYAAGLLCKLCPSFQPHQLIQYLLELYKYLLDLYSYILDFRDSLVDLSEYLLTEYLLE